MKRFILSLFFIVIVYLLAGNLVLFQDNLQAEGSKDDFNIVLITIDALRADHLSCYGYERNTSPTIDRISEKGIIFKNAIAPSSWTAPSMASLHTSLYPINHGVIHGIGYKKNKTVHVQEVFSDELTTLAEILKTRGYTTFGVASNLHLSEKFGFARGFDYFKCLSFLPARPVNKTIYSWEDKIKKSDKFFLWVHYFDPHDPYSSRSPWIEKYIPEKSVDKLNLSLKTVPALSKLITKFKKDPQILSNLIALYDSEINFVDSYIGQLIHKFELDKNTLIIITADHGEEFLDHGYFGHGHNLYQETIHIPLIIKLPDGTKKETINNHVNLIDVMPTILDMLSIDPPKQTLGKSLVKKKGLLSWLKELLSRKDSSDYTFSELTRGPIFKTILTPEWKYIYNYKNKKEQLYNIKSDSSELNNLVSKSTEQRNKLKEQLLDWASNSKKYPTKKQPIHLSPQEKEKLKGLGYIK